MSSIPSHIVAEIKIVIIVIIVIIFIVAPVVPVIPVVPVVHDAHAAHGVVHGVGNVDGVGQVGDGWTVFAVVGVQDAEERGSYDSLALREVGRNVERDADVVPVGGEV